MKYFTNLFVFLAWYLEKISDINATSITQKEQIQKLKLNETWLSDHFELAKVMLALKRNILLLTSTNAYIIHSENTTRILKIQGINILNPFSIAETPDGAFDVPSVTVTSQDKIFLLDVSDPMKPTIASDLTIVTYYYHVWINKNEFFAGNDIRLSLFEIKNKGEAKEWNWNTVSLGIHRDLVLYQYAPNSFVVYTSSTKQIQLIWPEDAAGKPGDWRNEEHIRQKYIECDTRFLTSADLNNDGKTDLLVAFQLEKEINYDEENVLPELEKEIDDETKCYFEVRAYEIPEEFKNPDKYTKHVLISSNNSRSCECINHLKAFTPFTSYKGKPWILVSHSECGEASYLQPESEEVGNWNYKMIQFHLNSDEVRGIEVEDINQDGYTELYILADRLHVYSFSNGKITVTDPSSTLSSLPDPSSTPSSSSIFYMDSTLLMFIWLIV